MATLAVNDAITEVKRIFPDSARVGIGAYASIAEEYLAKADRYLADHLPIRWDSEDINITTGTAEYAFATEPARVWSVRYIKSAAQDDNYRLVQTDITKLDIQHGNWRGAQNGEPQMFYLGSTSTGALRLGVTPAPDVTTSGGYPILRAYCTRFAAIVAGGNLPANIRSSDVYVFVACWRYALDQRRPEEIIGYWENRAKQAIAAERDFFFGRSAYDKPEIMHGSFPGGGVI